MNPGFFSNWAPKIHGATTHFPIAFAFGSLVFETAALALGGRPSARTLRATGYWSVVLGALGSLGAVASGLVMTKGRVLGHGALRLHHWYLWPAFVLLIALATWRILTGEVASRGARVSYLVLLAVMTGLMSAAGYYGGEMMIAR